MAYHKNLDTTTRTFHVHRALVDVADSINSSAPNNHYIKYMFRTSLTKKFVPVYATYVLMSWNGTWSSGGSLQLLVRALDQVMVTEGTGPGDNTTWSAGETVVPTVTMDFFTGTYYAGRESNGNDIQESTIIEPNKYIHIANVGSSSPIVTTCFINVFIKGYYLDI